MDYKIGDYVIDKVGMDIAIVVSILNRYTYVNYIKSSVFACSIQGSFNNKNWDKEMYLISDSIVFKEYLEQSLLRHMKKN